MNPVLLTLTSIVTSIFYECGWHHIDHDATSIPQQFNGYFPLMLDFVDADMYL